VGRATYLKGEELPQSCWLLEGNVWRSLSNQGCASLVLGLEAEQFNNGQLLVVYAAAD